MLIEIESVYEDAIIHGKSLSRQELQTITKELITEVGEENFINTFCLRFNYEKLTHNSNIHSDYIIDLDTHIIKKFKTVNIHYCKSGCFQLKQPLFLILSYHYLINSYIAL